jgi:exosortase D (VPLPA-CTERM-specific)
MSPLLWGVFLVLGCVLAAMFYDGLLLMVKWWERDEYSHGYLIPLIVIFLIWQKRDVLEQMVFKGAWSGVLVVLLGAFVYFVGELSSLYVIIQYGFLITLYGIVLALMGWQAFKIVWVPLLMLMFMIPLPTFVYNNLSSELQLISSQIGVAFIRLFGISIFLEGNVIDLGSYKLQVVEACSGLRYLFPLMTLGFIAAYFFKAAFWKRVVIFLSSIPITILMNSIRIGAIGVMVEYWGQSMAEGFLHYFEGWVIFMACTAILVMEMWLLAHIGKEHKSLHETFGLDFPDPTPPDTEVISRKVPLQVYSATGLLVLALLASMQMAEKTEIIPERASFSGFPAQIGSWMGRPDQMEQIYIDALKFDDYVITNYKDVDGSLVNFYVAYYGSQSKGESAHSPRSCIPGGGWQIKSLTQEVITDVTMGGIPLRVNRVVIRKDDIAQVVYYWFQGRNRIITNEYMVKWYLLWDGLTRSRTDGALVRLTAFVKPGEDLSIVDSRLKAFAREVSGHLVDYIPN